MILECSCLDALLVCIRPQVLKWTNGALCDMIHLDSFSMLHIDASSCQMIPKPASASKHPSMDDSKVLHPALEQFQQRGPSQDHGSPSPDSVHKKALLFASWLLCSSSAWVGNEEARAAGDRCILEPASSTCLMPDCLSSRTERAQTVGSFRTTNKRLLHFKSHEGRSFALTMSTALCLSSANSCDPPTCALGGSCHCGVHLRIMGGRTWAQTQFCRKLLFANCSGTTWVSNGEARSVGAR